MKNKKIHTRLVVSILFFSLFLISLYFVFAKNKTENKYTKEEVEQIDSIVGDLSAKDVKPDLSVFDDLNKTIPSEIKISLDKKEVNIENSKDNLFFDLLNAREEINSFDQSLVDIKNKLKLNFKKLSQLRVDNVLEIKKEVGDTYPNILLTLDEILKIEETRQKDLNLIFGDIFLDIIFYDLTINDFIKDFDNSDILKIKSLLDKHNLKMQTLAQSVDKEVDNTLKDDEKNSLQTQESLQLLVRLAGEYNLLNNTLKEIEELKKEVQLSPSIVDNNIYININAPIKQIDDNFCKYPKTKYVLIPQKGWTQVRYCSNGSFVEADKYLSNKVKTFTEAEKCNLLKVGAVTNYTPVKVDCN